MKMATAAAAAVVVAVVVVVVVVADSKNALFYCACVSILQYTGCLWRCLGGVAGCWRWGIIRVNYITNVPCSTRLQVIKYTSGGNILITCILYLGGSSLNDPSQTFDPNKLQLISRYYFALQY